MPIFTSLSRAATLCVTALAFAAAPSVAQHVTVGIGAMGGVPHDQFHESLNTVGFGVSGMVLYGIGPISAGIEAGALTYDRRAFPLPPDIDSQSAFIGDVTRTSSIGHVHAVLRLQLPEGPIRPYVDGLVGFQRFQTVTEYEQNVVVGGGSVFWPPATRHTHRTTSLDSHDTSLSYGAGAGVMIRLASGVDAGMPFDAFLDIGARYVFGEEATYRLVDIRRDGSLVTRFDRTRTNIIRPQISLVVQLGV